ncbi:SPARC-like protein 1 [Pelodytes ibericus]
MALSFMEITTLVMFLNDFILLISLCTDILKQVHQVKDGSQEKDDDFGIIHSEHKLESKSLITRDTDVHLDDGISEIGKFNLNYLLSHEKERRNHKESYTMNIEDKHSESKNAYESTESTDTVEDNKYDGDSSDTSMEARELRLLIQDSIQSESNEKQSGDNLSSDDLTDQYETTIVKFQTDELDENDKKEYINILEEYSNVNVPQHDEENKKEIITETERELFSKEIDHTVYFGSSDNKKYEPKNDEDYHDNAQSNYSAQAKDQEKAILLKAIIPQVDLENSSGEEKDAIESGPEQVVPFNVTGENGRNEDITDKKMLDNLGYRPPSLTSQKNQTSVLNSTEIQDEHKDHQFNTMLDQAKDSVLTDPCRNFHCKKGKTCGIDVKGNPTCVCHNPSSCPVGNINDHVCGTDNKTYDSQCHLFGTKCNLEGTKEGNHLHLDYQGLCKYIPPCSEYELALFPFRMRDWLKNVLIQLYERDLENFEFLSEKQRNKVKKIYENEKRLVEGDHSIDLLIRDFEKNYHMYVYPVHWQFFQLDRTSADRLLTRSELAPLRVPLVPMEHCVTTFFQECNTNKDKHISLKEWCYCFGIKEEDIDEDLLF